MKEYRAAWVAIIISSAALYLFVNGTVTIALLSISIALPILSLILHKLCVRSIVFTLTESEDGEGLFIDASNRTPLPASHVYVDLDFNNIRTNGTESVRIPMSIGPYRKTRIPLHHDFRHFGRYEIRTQKISVYDPLRLHSSDLEPNTAIYRTVRPSAFPMILEVSGSSSAMSDAEKYSDRRSGNDPGEVRAIHDYVPGDPVRNIHWKLSEKQDKLLVKELGLPVTDRFMALLDTSCSGVSENGMDAIVKAYISLIEALRDEGFEFTAGWTEDTGGLRTFKISNDSVLQQCKDSILAVPPAQPDFCAQLKNQLSGHRPSHLIVVGADMPTRIDEFAESSKVSLLLLDHTSRISIEDGLSVTGFGEGSCESDLAYVEI